MPDQNGTAVVMKCADIETLEQYLTCLSHELNTDLFEVMPAQFDALEQSSITLQNFQNACSRNRHLYEESFDHREERLRKAREYQKRKYLEETPMQRQKRLEK